MDNENKRTGSSPKAAWRKQGLDMDVSTDILDRHTHTQYPGPEGGRGDTWIVRVRHG